MSDPDIEPSRVGAIAAEISVRRLLMAVVLLAGCAELAYAVVNVSAMPVFIPAIGLDVRWIGIAGTAFLLAEGILKSPFGILGDRIGRKRMILIGPSISTFTCLLTPMVRNPYLLVLLRTIDGVGAAALWPAAFSLIGDHVPEEKRATGMSLFNLSYLVGIALGPALGGFVNVWSHHHLHVSVAHSKEASFYVGSALFAMTSVVALAFLPNTRSVQHTPTAEEGGFDLQSFRRMLSRMPMTLLMTFITFLGIGFIMLYVKRFALDTFHINESEFGVLLLGPALVIALVSVPLGTLGDRIGKATAVKIGIGLCCIVFWMLVLHPTKWGLVVFGALIGVGFVIAFPAWMALISTLCPSGQRGAAVGAVGTAQGLGAIVGAATSGFLYKTPAIQLGAIRIPAHGLPFLACALMLTFSFLLALTTMSDRPTLREGTQ